MTLQLLSEKGYRRMEEAQAEVLWRFWFDHTGTRCTHGKQCRAGVRRGALLFSSAQPRPLRPSAAAKDSRASLLTYPACAARWPGLCRRQLLGTAPRLRVQQWHAQAQPAPRLRRRAARLVRPPCCSFGAPAGLHSSDTVAMWRPAELASTRLLLRVCPFFTHSLPNHPCRAKLEKLHNSSRWGRRREDGTKWPLRVIKVVGEEGNPIVGVEAECKVSSGALCCAA